MQNRLIVDNVLGMTFDMDSEYLERQFLLPYLNQLAKTIQSKNVDVCPVEILTLFYQSLVFVGDVEACSVVSRSDWESYHILLYILEMYYRGFLGENYPERISRFHLKNVSPCDKNIFRKYIKEKFTRKYLRSFGFPICQMKI